MRLLAEVKHSIVLQDMQMEIEFHVQLLLVMSIRKETLNVS